MKKLLKAGILSAFFLVGCEQEVQTGFSKDNLKDNWVLTKIDGKDVNISEPRTPPGMTIDTEWKVAGFSGCNRFFGQVEVTEESKLRITAMGSTKMACIQDDQATVESIMTKSLQKWNSIALENNILTLTSEQHILTFMPEAISGSEPPQ
ncbi:META domain-containing protein [Photobacterium sp. OFAV2-7]|uniref:META domain-containing protein n=1 Tax=Photobacterium sp. OFAV2-7 TaxID=2917748 RepID=UPI001EF57B20|nr:META domain-containing protein [Photobacterium sp. OFAV2-7]MCG7586178.1 META domain-containing protein [Photobacterium sp. OFAV2-7]